MDILSGPGKNEAQIPTVISIFYIAAIIFIKWHLWMNPRGLKVLPKWSQETSKQLQGDPRVDQERPRGCSRCPRLPQETVAWPEMTPGGAPGPILHVQGESRRPQDGSKMAPMGPNWCRKEAEWTSRMSKMCQKCDQQWKPYWTTVLLKMMFFHWLFQ